MLCRGKSGIMADRDSTPTDIPSFLHVEDQKHRWELLMGNIGSFQNQFQCQGEGPWHQTRCSGHLGVQDTQEAFLIEF